MAEGDLHYSDIEHILKESFKLTEESIYVEDVGVAELGGIVSISKVMISRIQEQVWASYTLFRDGHWATFEVGARACLEYAIQVAYILNKDQKNRIGWYFGSHFSIAEKRQKQFKEVFSATGNQLKIHDQASSYLQTRNEVIRRYLLACGVQLDSTPPKVSLLNMCEDLDIVALYRGVYSRLSSTAHADAESLVDFIIVYLLDHKDRVDVQKKAADEVSDWMLYYLLIVLDLYFDALRIFQTCFEIRDMKIGLPQLEEQFSKIYEKYMRSLDLEN